MKLLLSILMIGAFQICSAQSGETYTDSLGSVIVQKDYRIEMLANKQAEINKRSSKLSSSGQYRGYRIQVYNAQNRDEANLVKAELLRRFPDQKTYLLYQAPNFRVRLGNFLTQKDAADLRKMLSALYPNRGIYIVPDLIEYTPTEEEEELL